MAGLPLSQAIGEYLAWLELDRHASAGTVHGYRRDLQRFSDFVGGDAGVPDIAGVDRELMRGYQRHLARAGTGPKGARRPLAVSTRARRLVALRSFLRFAAREEWLPAIWAPPWMCPSCPNDSLNRWSRAIGISCWRPCRRTPWRTNAIEP